MKFHQIILKLFLRQRKAAKEKEKHRPVSILDGIIHDRDWYRPLDVKQERRKLIKTKP